MIHVQFPGSAPVEAFLTAADVAHVRKLLAPSSAELGGAPAPWWDCIIVAVAARNDGSPIAPAVADGYRRLFDRLAALVREGELLDAVVSTASQLLFEAMAAGAAAPSMGWHGGEAVVLMWTVEDEATAYFTVEATEFSMLKERESIVLARRDNISLSEWRLLFRAPYGRH